LFQENINVIDDPLIKKDWDQEIFDSEGVGCKKLELIKKENLMRLF
jgi:predicted Zn-dependent protease